MRQTFFFLSMQHVCMSLGKSQEFQSYFSKISDKQKGKKQGNLITNLNRLVIFKSEFTELFKKKEEKGSSKLIGNQKIVSISKNQLDQ